MKVKVLYFAKIRQLLNLTKEEIILDTSIDSCTVNDVINAVLSLHPSLSVYILTCALSLNQTYATRDELVSEGDEIAIIPPVSGG
jgi:molybdopterin converting factor subunit 1